MSSRPVVAMALGGLGGFNAHDAGVLAAAHECGLEPDIITCTSGAIEWTHLFLTNPGGIREQVEQQVDAVSGANAVEVAVLGDPAEDPEGLRVDEDATDALRAKRHAAALV